MHNWTEYQKSIFQFPLSNYQHGLVQAAPGAGKTSTSVETLNYINKKTIFLAFSSKIAKSLQTKVPKHTDARTLNSFGWKVCVQHFPNVQLDVNKTFNVLKGFIDPDSDKDLFFAIQGPLRRIVSILKNMNQHDTSNWQECADKCGMELPDWSTKPKFYEAFDNLLPDLYEQCIRITSHMDYDDQVFQPIFRDLPIPKWPFVIVDEAQDLNAVNIEWLNQLAISGSRILMVGDEYQAIFSFRGSLTDSMDTLRQTFSPKDYDLPICFRCPEEVIKLAQQINPKLQSPEGNRKGFVEHVKLEKFREIVEPRHFVISRTTLPLVTEVMRLVVKGVFAFVEGKEVTENLFKTIDRVWYTRMRTSYNLSRLVNDFRRGCDTSQFDITDFTDELLEDRNERVARLARDGKEDIIESLNETVDTILAIADSCNHVPELIVKIESVFKDSEQETIERPAIRAMTCHKVKGLENPIVHHLFRDQDIPHKKAVKSGQAWQMKQETNLKFVSDTRAQEGYYIVEKPLKGY